VSGTARWLAVAVESPSEEAAPLLAEGLVASGATAVQEDGTSLRTFLPPPAADVEEAMRRLEATLAALAGAPVALRWSWYDEEDWSERWRSGIEARRVGRRLVVTPSWIAPAAGPDDIVLVVDPEMAFGTGEHATTRSALRLIERAVAPGARVLDVGTGSGILAIAAALLGAARVDAVECDPDAIPYAEANAARHGVGARVRVEQAFVDVDWLARHHAAYDLIAANVLSGVLRPLLPALRAALHPAGALVLGGILAEEADALVGAAEAAGFALSAEEREDEWWTGLFAASATAGQGTS
jgi:ribosomal protein L11 methyltransferase